MKPFAATIVVVLGVLGVSVGGCVLYEAGVNHAETSIKDSCESDNAWVQIGNNKYLCFTQEQFVATVRHDIAVYLKEHRGVSFIPEDKAGSAI